MLHIVLLLQRGIFMSQQGGGAQEAMQKFGRFLSGMVMPNIGAFIAWGFLTALFIIWHRSAHR